MATLTSELILSMVNRVTGPARAVQADMRRVRDTAGRMGSQIARTARGFTLAATAAAGGIFALAQSTAAQGDRVSKFARIMGISAEKYQELEFAAERAGISNTQFQSNMTAMTKRIGEGVQKGTGPAVDAFEELGLNINEVAELPADTQIGIIADKMSEMDNATRRSAVAAQIFSRSGIAMQNVLENGSKALSEEAQLARDLNRVLTNEQAAAGEDFEDGFTNATSALKGVAQTFGAELMPAITEFMNKFSEFVTENPRQIRTMAEDFAAGVQRMLEGLPNLLTKLGDFLTKVKDIATNVKDMVGGFDNLLKIIGSLLVFRTVASMILFAAAVGKLAASAVILAGANIAGASATLANMAGLSGIALLATRMSRIATSAKVIMAFLGKKFVPGLGFVVPDQIADGTLTPEAEAFDPSQENIDKMFNTPSENNNIPSPRSLQDLQEHAEHLRAEMNGVQERIDQIDQGGPMASGIVAPLMRELRNLQDELANVERAMDRVRNRTGGASPSAADSIEARAGGGPVQRGRTYMTGEEGPELFTPQRSGFIHTARETAAMAARASAIGASIASPVAALPGAASVAQIPSITIPQPRAFSVPQAAPSPTASIAAQAPTAQAPVQAPAPSGPTSITFGNIIVQGGANASAEELGQEFGRQVAAKMRSQFSDEF